MMKEVLIRNAQNGAAAAAAMARVVACALCVGSLLVLSTCTGSTQKAGTIDPSVHVDPGGTAHFPSHAQLRRTTVSLRLVGFTFGSGMTLNDQGEPARLASPCPIPLHCSKTLLRPDTRTRAGVER